MENERLKEWLIAYKGTNDRWVTIVLPKEISEHAVEQLLLSLNQSFDVAYVRTTHLYPENEKHITKKGEFIGLW